MLNNSLLLPVFFVIVGLIGLAWSADKFISGAAAIARNLGISAIVVGITIVGFGTSAPELLVSANAALSGNPGLAIGNAVGSNIANFGLVIGAAALVSSIAIQSRILKQEIPLTAFSILLAGWALHDLYLQSWEALILLVWLILILIFLIWRARQKDVPHDELNQEFNDVLTEKAKLFTSISWTVVGLIILLVSARVLVMGATDIARAFQVSDLIIGLTIVAIGTSLPEVAAAVSSVRQNQTDIAVGNVLGSNIFNMLGVIGIAGILQPTTVEAEILSRDFPVMLILLLGFVLFGLVFKKFYRWKGALFIIMYIGYLAFLGYSIQS